MQLGARRIGRLLAFLRRQVMRDEQEAALARSFGVRNRVLKAGNDAIAVQCVTDDLYYFSVFGKMATALRSRGGLRVDRVVTQSLNVGELQSPIAFLGLRFVLNTLLIRKWSALYASFSDRVAYRSTSLALFADFVDLWRARRCWKELECKRALMALDIDGIPVGDLVNDSYLRFKPAPTVDLKDPFLWVVLWQAHRDVRRAERYFSSTRPKAYLTSYSTYVQHGIPVRVALKYGVDVLSFGNFQEFCKRLGAEDWVHTKDAQHYSRDFAALDDQPRRLAEAQSALEARVRGKIDAATSYMKRSAYEDSGEAVPDVRGKPVVFLHDFFDSPHVYYDMVFHDFWEWVCFTLDTFRRAGIPVVVKPHPNQIGLSGGVLVDLMKKYPDVMFISTRITNRQLAEAGVACAVTVYGTVAHEMAFLGVSSIACARHPHVSFSFCRTARTRQEYAELLETFSASPADGPRLRHDSLAFYYMHNLGSNTDERALSDAALGFRGDCASYEASGKDMLAALDGLARLPSFAGFTETIGGRVFGT
jgi:hypothetical protein